MRKLVIILFLAVAAQSQAALTLVQRETFQAVGTLDSGTPGNLGVVDQGTYYKRAVGPRVTNDSTANSLGWSADLRQVAGSGTRAQHTQTIQATAAATSGMWSAWFYFNSVANNGSNLIFLTQTRDVNGNQFMRVMLSSATGTFWYNQGGLWTDSDTTVAYPVRQWFELRQTWANVSGSDYNFKLAYRLAGSSSWTTIRSGSPLSFGGTIKDVQGVSNLSTATGVFVGRYGMPGVYSISSFATDSTALISDVADPTGPATWYVNPSTGNDNNDGTDAAHAWQTVDKINTETQYGGFLAASSYATGDSLVIDTSGGSLDLTGAILTLQTQGLNVRSPITGSQYITCVPYKTMSAGGWSGPISGTTKVYQSSDTVALSVIWETDKWLTHVGGANLAAVKATLESTAGSFWTDGTTMYVHPFGDTNPGSDGKTYTRSHSGISTGAVNMNVGNLNVADIYVTKTCDAAAADGACNAGYGIAAGGLWTGTNRVFHCYTSYTGKHGIGLVADSDASEVTTIDSCEAEQGSPYGSQTPFVSFNGTTPVGIHHTYSNCVCLKDTGLIGSASGISGTATAFYSHNNSGSGQFIISLDGCNFASATTGGTNAMSSLTVNNTVFGGDLSGATTRVFTRCLMQKVGPNQSNASGTTTVRNCVIVPVTTNYNDDGVVAGGTVTIECNTYDLRGITSIVNNPGVLVHTGNATVTVRNNAFIFPANVGGSTEWVVFKNFTNGDTLVSTNNACEFHGQTNMAKAYNPGGGAVDKTFAQWQALGFDANSINSANLSLAADYKPHAGSPVINAGVDLGPLVDYTGRLFSPRNDIGAFEFVPSNISLIRRGGRRF